MTNGRARNRHFAKLVHPWPNRRKRPHFATVFDRECCFLRAIVVDSSSEPHAAAARGVWRPRTGDCVRKPGLVRASGVLEDAGAQPARRRLPATARPASCGGYLRAPAGAALDRGAPTHSLLDSQLNMNPHPAPAEPGDLGRGAVAPRSTRPGTGKKLRELGSARHRDEPIRRGGRGPSGARARPSITTPLAPTPSRAHQISPAMCAPWLPLIPALHRP